MKKGLLTSLILLFATMIASAQVKVGLKGGVSTFDFNPGEITILDQNEIEDFKLGVAEAKYGLHVGMFVQMVAGSFYIQPELLFSTQSVEYSLEDIQGVNDLLIRDESYQFLDIPVLAGFRFGPVRIGGGVIGHVLVNNTSDIQDITGYTQEMERFTYGWQAGVGLDIWRLHLDFRYEDSISEFGNHFVFHGKQYGFGAKPSKLIASLGVSF